MGEKSFYIANLRGWDYGDKPAGDIAMKGILDGGIYSNGMMNQYDWTVRNQINYNFTLNEVHNFNIDLGQEAKSTIYKGAQGSVFPGYMPDEGKTFSMFPMISPGDIYEYPTAIRRWFLSSSDGVFPVITDRRENSLSFYGTFTYSYQNLYSLNFNIRNDGSNRFGQYKNEKFNYLNEQINTRDEIKSIVGEEANYSIDNKHSDNNSLFGKFTKFLNTRNFKDTKVIKKEICVRENEPVCDEEPVMKYEDENVSEGETVLISDIIKDKKRKLFSLCDYDDIVINEYPFTIGKTSGKVDEIIEDKSVSRIHVRIDNEADSFTIEDLNSRNGTFVNGERLNPYDKIEISIGDKITIASLDYIFK